MTITQVPGQQKRENKPRNVDLLPTPLTSRRCPLLNQLFFPTMYYHVFSHYVSPCLFPSPAFTFPHPINPMTYQQILHQQRGLSSAFGHTPPFIQPSPTFPARQHVAVISVNSTPAQMSNSSNCIADSNQVGFWKDCNWAPRKALDRDAVSPPNRFHCLSASL